MSDILGVIEAINRKYGGEDNKVVKSSSKEEVNLFVNSLRKVHE